MNTGGEYSTLNMVGVCQDWGPEIRALAIYSARRTKNIQGFSYKVQIHVDMHTLFVNNFQAHSLIHIGNPDPNFYSLQSQK